MRPVAKRFPVSNDFGRPGNYLAGYHTGIDYACPVGTPIRAVWKGKVVSAGWDNAYGNYIVVHTFWRFRQNWYCHLSRGLVKTGQRVKRGQVIGYSGNTGNSTGPHLHLEQRRYPYTYWSHTRPKAV